jgi:hypothetical protein
MASRIPLSEALILSRDSFRVSHSRCVNIFSSGGAAPTALMTVFRKGGSSQFTPRATARDTIYVRAHAVFSGSTVPADGTTYIFSTSTTSLLPGIGSTTNGSSSVLTASAACVGGN